jgi:hypothetical protein
MKFVVVNGRMPCQQSFCALCREPIGAGYLREVGTRLAYCDHDCYDEHCKSAALLLESRSRASCAAAPGPLSRSAVPTSEKASLTLSAE